MDEKSQFMGSFMKIGIANDHAGYELKRKILAKLTDNNEYSIRDYGSDGTDSCDYPDYAELLIRSMLSEEIDRGILICGSGIGMSMFANRFPVIRAALCYSPKSAKLSREHNNSNVLVLVAKFTPDIMIETILENFLKTAFLGGRHARRVSKLSIFNGKF